jgi:zinc transport system ATP-binding protein
MTTEPVIQVEKLVVSYGDEPALTDVDLTVLEGDYLGIIGPNGGGKTTLLKSILGLIRPDSGRVLVHGKPLGKTNRPLAYVPQAGTVDRAFPISVFENVLLGLLPPDPKPFHRFSTTDRKKAMEVLESLGIGHLASRPIRAMSGGEYQKSMIARAIAGDPEILLLDEPTASVDPSSRSDIYDLLHRLNEKMTIVIATHDTLAISTHVKNLACLDRTLVYHGIPEMVGDAIAATYRCPVDIIAHGHTPHRVLKTHGKDNGHD